MKPIYEKLIGCPDEGFIVKQIQGEACNCSWHCHAEVELVLVLQSRGYRIVGDNIRSLQPGDLVLLGPNLPHAYQHTDRLSAARSPPECILLQFEERLWSGMLELPAMDGVRRLLQRAAHGLHVLDPTRKQVVAMLGEMLKLRGPRRMAVFLGVLGALRSRGAAGRLPAPASPRRPPPTRSNGSDGSANSSTKTIIASCGWPRSPN